MKKTCICFLYYKKKFDPIICQVNSVCAWGWVGGGGGYDKMLEGIRFQI